ncbi:drug resistance transporter EmrB/QacA subfamily [Tricladium varicosporioides]|nr:drug resistance transporter EmrB/QacA subfamily [Hymenoscyphus varicosporioides]
MKGWKLYLLNFALCLSLFLSTVESTIVSTTLVAITNSLGGFQKSSWIITSYLLTYTGFLTIVAKLSDILGRKSVLISCLVIFTTFSISCGIAQGLETLIILRAFQGIGGGGIYTMVFVILPEMVAPQQYPTYAAILSSVFALSYLLGPILGGIITDHSTWRWIFYLNGPAGVVALILTWIALPSNFPHPPGYVEDKPLTNLQKFQRLDIVGCFLLLAASLLFVTAIEEGGTEYLWSSSVVITLLVISLLLWPIVLFWSWYQERRTTVQEPVLPWRVLTNRFSMTPLLNSFFSGAAFISLIIILPQKFQVVYGSSPTDAGYKLLVLTLCTPVGSALAGLFMQKVKTPPMYILLAGGVIQLLGMALMTTLKEAGGTPFPLTQYGYEVVMGVGFGLSLGTVVMMSPLVFEKRDMAVGMGAMNQFRVLGGCVALAICTNLLNNKVTLDLKNILSPLELRSLQSSASATANLSPTVLWQVREAFLKGFEQQMLPLIGFGGGAILVSLFMIERNPRWQKS